MYYILPQFFLIVETCIKALDMFAVVTCITTLDAHRRLILGGKSRVLSQRRKLLERTSIIKREKKAKLANLQRYYTRSRANSGIRFDDVRH
jgi:hypothetical protein